MRAAGSVLWSAKSMKCTPTTTTTVAVKHWKCHVKLTTVSVDLTRHVIK